MNLQSHGSKSSVEPTTKTEPTDAYGKIKFFNSSSKKAQVKCKFIFIERNQNIFCFIIQYIRLENLTNVEKVRRLMLNTWNLQPPELIISVTGAAQNFNLEEQMKEKFKGAFIKAAKKTKAWVFSGGSNCGVMHLLGEAIKEDLYPDIPLIGVGSWGAVASKEKLVVSNLMYFA